jgi:hypothetical protein
MNLFVEALTKTRESYARYEKNMGWLYKFLDSLNIVGENRETLKIHTIYFIQGSESFEDFKQWVLPLGVGNLFDDKWWDEQTKNLKVMQNELERS